MYQGTDSGGTSPLLMAGRRQVINRISKDSQNILIFNFIITTFDSQGRGISARAFLLARLAVAPPLGTDDDNDEDDDDDCYDNNRP